MEVAIKKPVEETAPFEKAWNGFQVGPWQHTIDVRSFIQLNYTPYYGDHAFLEDATGATRKLWQRVQAGLVEEHKRHAPLAIDAETPSNITSHNPGYIDQDLEKIVGLQTDAPFKRSIMPNGGLRMVESACDIYGVELNPAVKETFTKYRKTHNQAVFETYTEEIKKCRKSGILTGLPDAYGRGRIIGDYRRVALYGIDYLIAEKQIEKSELAQRMGAAINMDGSDTINDKTASSDIEATIRLSEELADQISALEEMKLMADSYGLNIGRPAYDAREAIQWTYMGYLAAIKSQNGAAMSLGRVSTFIDIYIERDLAQGTLDELEAQELVDHFVMKLRLVRFLRTPEYDELFSGDPIWATESLGGMGLDGRTLVTKSSFRFLNTLYTMGPSPEPNLTVLWSADLPEGFKLFCAKVSIETSSIQYENDDLMRKSLASDDYGIACCVSPMIIGKQMQFFGARANLAKLLLYAINNGRDEKSGEQIGPRGEPLVTEVLDYDSVMERLDIQMEWLANQYVTALNVIHYMHDRYCYESALMALHDLDVKRTMACGIAGLSVVADSLSAIKHAKVRAIRDETGLATDFATEGSFPTFGNNDPRVDDIASMLVTRFMNKLRRRRTYRSAEPTQSILTITSNVVYGKKTGNTPDGRRSGQPYGPGANPMHGRDQSGAIASLQSIAQLPFRDSSDGISYTFSIVPQALGKTVSERQSNLVGLLDGYFHSSETVEGGQHVNVNVLNREMLIDAIDHPDKYPQLTIRVSGYAVVFHALTHEQQLDVITRTFTEQL